MRRTFAADRASVFEAMTTPALLREWLGAQGRALTVCDVDLRDGGSYRYVFRMGEDREFGMRGTYREIVPGERIVNTESYEGYDWKPLVVTTRFEEEAGPMTRVEVKVVYPSKEICDRDFPNLQQSGTAYNRLAEVLAAWGQEDRDGR